MVCDRSWSSVLLAGGRGLDQIEPSITTNSRAKQSSSAAVGAVSARPTQRRSTRNHTADVPNATPSLSDPVTSSAAVPVTTMGTASPQALASSATTSGTSGLAIDQQLANAKETRGEDEVTGMTLEQMHQQME